MKRQLTLLVVSATLLGGTLLCQAMPGPDNRAPHGCAGPDSREPFPARLAHILELSEAQKTKILAILDEERNLDSTQQAKEGELRGQLHQAERAASFDEQAVRKAASALAGIETERMVRRTKTHYRINAVLTETQRSLAERLRPERKERPGPPCDGGPEGRHPHGPEADHEWR